MSLSKLNIPIVTITNFNSNDLPIEKRHCYIVCARIHPGESNSSWIAHVRINIILKNLRA